MVIYGLALLPLAEWIAKEVPDLVQPWYAYDAAMVGVASSINTPVLKLLEMGPAWGKFPKPDKSVVVCHPRAREAVLQHLEQFWFKLLDGHRYLGGISALTEPARSSGSEVDKGSQNSCDGRTTISPNRICRFGTLAPIQVELPPTCHATNQQHIQHCGTGHQGQVPTGLVWR